MARILSCFHDETGEEDMRAGYYMVAMVLHDQEIPISEYIQKYKERLASSGLEDVPFHMSDLLHGHEGYEGMDLADRKRMLVAFGTFVRTLPIEYHVFRYTDFDEKNPDQLASRLGGDVEAYIKSNLSRFQEFDEVAVYYDGGQKSVSKALRNAFDAALASNVATYKKPRYEDKCLYQAADYFCSIELAAKRYESGSVSSTYNKFFGDWKSFRANYLKIAKRKRIG